MSPLITLLLLSGYFAILMGIAYLTGRGGSTATFYVGKRTAPWPAIAFGMVGVSLSGVSFISVPGLVLRGQFHYMQMVLGYIVGYYAIAYILLPIYYRLRIPSIYSYLKERFGSWSHKTGALLFFISRLTVAALRLMLVAHVLQTFIFSAWGIPFWVTVAVTIGLIWLYTHRGGMQTVIWTDVFQTSVMLISLIITIILISQQLHSPSLEILRRVADSGYASWFEFSDWKSPYHFVKQFLAGVFIPIAMTGLDQDMMQKNLGCRTLRDAQRNMVAYGYAFTPINLLLLGLGVLLILYSQQVALPLPAKPDDLYTGVVTAGLLPPMVGLLFTLGIIAAAYSSADSALTALTTSFTLDILGVKEPALRGTTDQNTQPSNASALSRVRGKLQPTRIVHLALSVALLGTILLFSLLGEGSVISTLFTAVGYTYGPLLGLYTLGIFTRKRPREQLVPIICLLAPILCYTGQWYIALRTGYHMGYELLLVNGALTFAGLWLSAIGRKYAQ
ncbi:MAG: hypothetical protein AL399_06100 [Candidatus [Bacteroides] periocalifornicus]|uniref:Sodium:solute symporter n=1 Tax=Candidatus [Bacteroides] periocalifornicus TaxID=1702214 RepID=A0A0Q4B430_9BACT|nr:MAG: hypothetical protein AL399_06100 [Candidatus [Bacteroides] periocalifornicus]